MRYWTRAAAVFPHGWPLSADDWDAQMMFFLVNAELLDFIRTG